MSAVSEQVSVGSGGIKEKSQCDYIRALRRVADGADIVLLVLDAGPRQLVGEKTIPMKQIYELRILKQKLQTQEGRENAVRGSRMDTSHRLIAKTSILTTGRRMSEAEPLSILLQSPVHDDVLTHHASPPQGLNTR
ncbi:hypothetical protein EDB84DRAFT_1438954 [Lactarius hengduanensis]|nr:hypothetical protein EDB84DRAFT_1438954 [Lactarius hengduanensis]